MKNIKVLVLMGGKSSEREVSLASGKGVAKALSEAGFETVTLDLDGNNLSEIAHIRPDVAFIALHGKGGEDGSVQGVLEWLGIPYTGPGLTASAVCMDKILTKKLLTLSGVATPRFLELGYLEEKDIKEAAKRAVDTLGLPVVFKASRQGSSIGVSIVRKQEEAEESLRSLLSIGDPILAEEFLSGKELSVPVLGNASPEILPIIEITSDGAFYDYHSKYTPGKSRHIIPAEILPEQAEKARELAKNAYLATGCRGYSRIDLLLDKNGEPQVLEVNTAPGMTETSLFPDAARAAGFTFPQLVERILNLALEK
ncbi:MAG: D-alanine--D-alanine ligase [Clostridia bacterium]|nr:D-alanine--D-alanine ligase [Clostridia bacterium]